MYEVTLGLLGINGTDSPDLNGRVFHRKKTNILVTRAG